MMVLSVALPAQGTRELFEAHAAYVHRLARHLGVDPGELDDVVQEVFATVFRRMDDYDPRRAAFRTWLYGICVGVVRNHRRKAYRRRERPSASVPEETHERTPERALVQRRRLARLAAALDALDEGKRAVFVLYELEELEMTEVAEVLGIPRKTAYSRLYAAREQVLARLKEGA